MWFEILPSGAIIGIALTIPPLFGYWSNKIVTGTGYRRFTIMEHHRVHYLRDMRLTGDPYTQLGLADLPDESAANQGASKSKK